MEVRYIVAGLIVLTVLLAVGLNRLRLIEAGVFMLPFRSISFDYGLSFSIGQLLCVFALGQLLLVRPKRLRFDGPFLLFIGYCTLATVVISLLFMDYIEVKGGNFLREDGRFIAQLVLKLFFVFGTIFTVYSYATDVTKLRRILKCLLHGIALLGLLGVVQFLVFKVTGTDIFPIADLSRTDGGRTSVFDTFSGLAGWLRVNSFGGEPKGLAAIVAVGTGLLLMARSASLRIIKQPLLLAATLAVVCVLTLSTGGIALCAAMIACFVLLTLLINRYNWNPLRPLILGPLLAALVLTVRFGDFLGELFQQRFVDRFQGEHTSGGVEDFDQTILAFLTDNPEWVVFGSGWGNIHNLTQDYIPGMFAYYMANTVFVAKSGYLQLISENGVVGALLLVFAEFFLLLRLYRSFGWNRYGKFFFVAVAMTFAAYLIRSNYVVYEYVVIHGLALASLAISVPTRRGVSRPRTL